ncbi:hypothetical protein G3I20_13015, partial [Streptomyces sp. SID8111]|nr:hypothetical protein [Streptomyces sp. SID8111]
ARRDRLRARAVTTTVVATVVAAPVLALWAAYRGTPVGEAEDGRSASAREADGPVDLDGEGPGGYENAGNASTRPDSRFDKDGKKKTADVSVEVVEVAGGDRKGAAALGVTAGHHGDTTLITLTATGSAPVRWSASTGAHWLYLSRSSGTLRPGESLTIKVYVDQLREPSGHWQARVAVSPAGAVVTIDGYGTAPGPSRPGSPHPGHPGSPGTSHPGTPSGPPPTTEPDPTPTTPTEPTPSDPPPTTDPEPSPDDPAPTAPADSSPPGPGGSGDPSPSTS